MAKQSNYLLLIGLFIGSCNMSDSVENLSGGYQFPHEGKNRNSINGKNSISANVVGYNADNNFIVVEQEPNKEAYKAALGYDLRNRYIVYSNNLSSSGDVRVENQQINKDSSLFVLLSQKGMSNNNTKEDRIISEIVADSILSFNDTYQKLFSLKRAYWIITLSNDELIGPLTQGEYIQKRKELNVPDRLQIEPVEI